MSSLLELGIICTAIGVIVGIYGFSIRKYKIDLENEGRAASTLGVIGSHYHEGHSFWLIFFTVNLPVCMLGSFGGILSYQLFGSQIGDAITPYLLILAIGILVSMFSYSAFTTSGRSQRRAVKFLRKYWWSTPPSESNFRVKLTELAAGDKIDRATVKFLARRGCTASLIAKEVLAAGIQEQ